MTLRLGVEEGNMCGGMSHGPHIPRKPFSRNLVTYALPVQEAAVFPKVRTRCDNVVSAPPGHRLRIVPP